MAHRIIAKEFLSGKYAVLDAEQFDHITWSQVYSTLMKSMPRLISIWASKQVTRTTGINALLSHIDGRDWKCLSCMMHNETTKHAPLCTEEGRTEGFLSTVALHALRCGWKK